MSEVLVADEVWIATALLHREQPECEDFSVAEILARVSSENLAGRLRPGVQTHVTQHCVANKPPNPGRYRMLFETTRGRRRLFRPGDPYHRDRGEGKTVPVAGEMPESHRELLEWYEAEYLGVASGGAPKRDPILALRGLGREIWQDEAADAYVRRLRESWD